MPLQRILIIVVALVAAMGALFVVRNASGPAASAVGAQPAALTGPKVLVAAKDISAGVVARADMLTWAAWPAAAANPNFLTEDANPKAAEEFVGAVARVDIQAGEPISPRRLIKRGDLGAFSAIIRPGYRAVAVPITRETAAANFIVPNDRVDVVLARKVEASGRGALEYRSDVIFENVRVLSVGEEVRPKDGDVKPMEGAVATIELAPRDVETLAMAKSMGDISLALRAVEADTDRVESARRPNVRALDQRLARDSGNEVKVHAFGKLSNAEAASQ
jgi:pilus assembly protein CpaB